MARYEYEVGYIWFTLLYIKIETYTEVSHKDSRTRQQKQVLFWIESIKNNTVNETKLFFWNEQTSNAKEKNVMNFNIATIIPMYKVKVVL